MKACACHTGSHIGVVWGGGSVMERRVKITGYRSVYDEQAHQHNLLPTTLIEHNDEHINEPNGYGVVCLYLLIVKPHLKTQHWVSTTHLHLLILHPEKHNTG